jgi:hypothetical protein
MTYIKSQTKIEIFQSIAALAIIAVMAFAFLFFAAGCSKPLYVPGATLGYYIWEDDRGNIHIVWTADRKDNSFDGRISTDGRITDYELIDLEEDDSVRISGDKTEIDFAAVLSSDDYSDELVLDVDDYEYIEFELKINEAYDLSRTNLGRFLNSPADGVFRITRGYFDELDEEPFYKRPPFSGLFEKLGSDIRFTIFYLFLMGVVAIELIRITVLRKKKKNNWYLFLCYGVLILIIMGIYFLLKILV